MTQDHAECCNSKPAPPQQPCGRTVTYWPESPQTINWENGLVLRLLEPFEQIKQGDHFRAAGGCIGIVNNSTHFGKQACEFDVPHYRACEKNSPMYIDHWAPFPMHFTHDGHVYTMRKSWEICERGDLIKTSVSLLDSPRAAQLDIGKPCGKFRSPHYKRAVAPVSKPQAEPKVDGTTMGCNCRFMIGPLSEIIVFDEHGKSHTFKNPTLINCKAILSGPKNPVVIQGD